MVRALELARLDSNRAYINALARFLPSSARLESELAQLNSNSILQLNELDCAFRVIQLVNRPLVDLLLGVLKFMLSTFVVAKFHLPTIDIWLKYFFLVAMALIICS